MILPRASTNLNPALVRVRISARGLTDGRSRASAGDELTVNRRLTLEVEDEADERLVRNGDPAVRICIVLTKRRRQRLQLAHGHIDSRDS